MPDETNTLKRLDSFPLLSSEWPLFICRESTYVEWLIDQSHDMQNLGSKMVKGAPVTTHWTPSKKVRGTYSYTWESTEASGGTTFMRKTNAFIKATGAPRY